MADTQIRSTDQDLEFRPTSLETPAAIHQIPSPFKDKIPADEKVLLITEVHAITIFRVNQLLKDEILERIWKK